MRVPSLLSALVLAAVVLAAPARAADTFNQEEIMAKAKGFFGDTTKGLAEAIQKVFKEQGEPNALILGEEARNWLA